MRGNFYAGLMENAGSAAPIRSEKTILIAGAALGLRAFDRAESGPDLPATAFEGAAQSLLPTTNLYFLSTSRASFSYACFAFFIG